MRSTDSSSTDQAELWISSIVPFRFCRAGTLKLKAGIPTSSRCCYSRCQPLITFAQVPRPYTIGSLLRFSKEASYWAFSIVGNWAERFRMYAHEDVATQQSKLEEPLFAAQVCTLWVKCATAATLTEQQKIAPQHQLHPYR